MNQFDKFRYVNDMPMKEKLFRLVWAGVWLLFFKTTPRWSFHGWRIFCLRVFGAKIGKGSKVSPTCFVWAPWNLEMGQYSALGDGVDCYNMAPIKIGSKVAVSQRSFLCGGTHDINTVMRPLIRRPIVIEDHAWICSESFIGPGVVIGKGSVVGARSVVIKDVSDWVVVAGNPARFIKMRDVIENKELL